MAVTVKEQGWLASRREKGWVSTMVADGSELFVIRVPKEPMRRSNWDSFVSTKSRMVSSFWVASHCEG